MTFGVHVKRQNKSELWERAQVIQVGPARETVMHVKSTLIAGAIIISSATVIGVPVQAQDRVSSEGQRLHRLCDEGDKRACVRFGMMFNENRAHHEEWRRSHPEFFSFQSRSDKGGSATQGVERGPTCPGVAFLIPARARACTKP